MKNFKKQTEFSLNEIHQILPHRYPFLLIDRIESLIPGKSVTALKNISINEPYFQGHFPGQPVMPACYSLSNAWQHMDTHGWSIQESRAGHEQLLS